MTNSIILQNVSQIELENMISNVIKHELHELKKDLNPKSDKEELLTREEVLELLKINASTLWHWTNKGKIKVHKYANKCYYKRSELMQSLTPLNKEAV